MTLAVGAMIYCSDQGLGYLARSFHRAGVINSVFIVEHPSHENHFDWYPAGSPRTRIRPLAVAAIQEWLRSLDVFLALENPFWWEAFAFCRQHGVKTALAVMYECFPRQYFGSPQHTPDLFLCPSLLDLEVFARLRSPACRVEHLPVPVEVPWRLRERAEVFVHMAGNGSFRDRNGTVLLQQALPYVKSPIRLILRAQPHGARNILPETARDKRVDVRVGVAPYESLWEEGDAFTFVDAWNGLCLPLQEAFAAGMLVIAGDRFPVSAWLPVEPLVPVSGYREACIGPSYLSFSEAHYDPREVAHVIDAWFGRDVTEWSRRGAEWARAMSWAELKPRYTRLLEEVAGRAA